MPSLVSSEYSDTPTRLPPVPRRVRARFGPMGWVAFGTYVLGLAWAGAYLSLLLCTLYLGVDVPGRVMNVTTSRSGRGDTTNNIYFSYTVGGQRYDGSAGVPDEMYWRFEKALRNKDPKVRDVTVRYFAAGPIRYVDFTPNSQLVSMMPLPIIAALFLMTVHYFLCVQFRMLYRHGRAVTGVIVSKYMRSGKNDTSYFIVYAFPDPVSGGEIKGKYDCGRRARYDKARVGERVTVLYNRRSARRSVPYEFGAYRVVLADGTAPEHAGR